MWPLSVQRQNANPNPNPDPNPNLNHPVFTHKGLTHVSLVPAFATTNV